MKFLVIHASLGAGHKRAAQALHEVLQNRGILADIRDLLDFLPGPMGPFYSKSYQFMIQDARWLWHFVYESANFPKSDYAPARSWTQKWQFERLKKFLREQKFTHILSTHFTPSALLTDWREASQLNAEVYSVVTDYIAHRMWKRTGLDGYFVPTEEVASQLLLGGIAPDKIAITGIPISAAFSSDLNRADARSTWSPNPDDSIVLILCSALNLSKTMRLLEEVSQVSGKCRFLVSTGHDQEKELKVRNRFAGDPRFTIFGFSNRIAEMMKASDLLISKPGGLIVSEALAIGLPQILFSPIPGQEEANAEYAVHHGAAVCIKEEPGAFTRILTELLGNSERLQSMTAAAQKIGKPRAAANIIDSILNKNAVTTS